MVTGVGGFIGFNIAKHYAIKNNVINLSQARFANALSFFQISQSLGSFGASTCGVGFAIVGLALAIQKNLNTIIAYAFILIGLIGSIISLWDYTSNLMLIWNVGSALLALISGILILRSKE